MVLQWDIIVIRTYCEREGSAMNGWGYRNPLLDFEFTRWSDLIPLGCVVLCIFVFLLTRFLIKRRSLKRDYGIVPRPLTMEQRVAIESINSDKLKAQGVQLNYTE